MPKQEYGADSLTVLEGLDAVRKRPGMYIGTTDSQGLMHCLWEIIDNAVDEALAGACDHITVTLHDDGSVEVADNGRGIPVDVEPKTKLTGVEVVLTKLHAGAKFGNASYNAAGGLHGVGSSVVNALSSRLDVEVDRDGKTHHMAFHQGHPGVYSDTDPEHPSPDAPFKRTRKNRPTEMEIIGKVSPKTTGTRIRYWADPEIFNDTAEFSYEQLIDRVRQTSFLVPGLRITVIDENVPETGDDSVDEMMEVDAAQTPADDGTGLMDAADIVSAADTAVEDTVEAGEAEARSAAVSAAVETAKVDAARHTHARVEEFRHTGGVKDFVDFLSAGEAVSDIWRITGEDTYEEETQAVGEGGELHAQKVTRKCGVDIAMRWTNGYDTTMRSFVNVVETPGGGMHVDGFLMGLTKQIRKAVEDNARKLKVNLKDSNMRVERDDILAGLVAVVTVRIAEPQFQGQTKDVLGTAPVKPIVTRMTDKQFGEITKYNAVVTLADDLSSEEQRRIDDLLDDGSLVTAHTLVMRQNMLAGGPDEQDKRMELVVPEDPASFDRFVALNTRVGHHPVKLDDDGLVLTEKLAAELGVRAGDAVTLTEQDAIGNATGTSYEATVTGIVENYVYHYAYMGPALYEQLMGKAPDYRTVLAVTTSDPDLRVQFSNDLLAAGGVKTVAYNDETIDAYRDMMSSVNMIVVVLVTAAAALAFIVLYNLTNINITERMREIATLKVLGFTPREMNAYIFREIFLLAAIGCAVGLVLGVWMEGFVVVTAEVDQIMFGRAIHPTSFLLAFLLTMLFTVLVMLAMRGKLRRIDMVESLKSNE